ncbi:MAG: GxxExxY protein [Gloeobacteraceae cyanobacterium ES-bin-144]|nr:GxxExxY protein [Verrucomicrobiales bacterium]
MDQKRTSNPHMDLTEKIIGAAMAVHRALGPGLDEKIYENALCLEFEAQTLAFTQQQQFPVFYRGTNVGKLITDLIVEEKVIIETKVASFINDAHITQTLSYLSISNLQVGLILNFKCASLTFKRVANIYLHNP